MRKIIIEIELKGCDAVSAHAIRRDILQALEESSNWILGEEVTEIHVGEPNE